MTAMNVTPYSSEPACIPVQSVYPETLDKPRIQLIIGGFYLTVLLLGVFGNLLTCFCVLWKKVVVTLN